MVGSGGTESFSEEYGKGFWEEGGLVGLSDVAAVVGLGREAFRVFALDAKVGVLKGTRGQGKVTR